ncbi:hypothetical protein [Pseudonocardia phyllosphaerae]|uniref:hypothetical protein n=1 Tax=Pseudonocardia phyllosphaerae TaxID=3390502 RepID=UPI00397E095D
MRFGGPLITLAAVGAVGAGMGVANVVLTEPEAPAAVQQAADSASLGRPLAAPPRAATDPGWAAQQQAAPAPSGKVVYDGRSTDGKVTVTIWVTNGKAKAYVCDGDELESWTRGTVQQGAATRLTGKNGAWVEYTVADGVATGTARAAGKSWEFSIGKKGPEKSGAGESGAGESGSGQSGDSTKKDWKADSSSGSAPAPAPEPAPAPAPPAGDGYGSGGYGGY